MSSGAGIHDHSLSIASVPGEGVLAIGIGTNIFIVIHDGVGERTEVVNDGQVVRSVAFLQSPTGSRYMVSGGDGKRVNMYGIPTLKGVPELQIRQSGLFSAGIPLSLCVGPHTKRITHVATCGDSTILFADKFGEVYRLDLAWTTNETPNSGPTTMVTCSAAPVFLLQHFSVMSTFFLSSPISGKACICHSTENEREKTTMTLPLLRRRLFTCDKDRHARVSCYPETFCIEQFLWNEAPQSVVTSITEIPCPTGLGNYSYFVVGCYNGILHLWVADNTLLDASGIEPFALVGTLTPQELGVTPTAAADGATGAVLSVVHVTMSSTSTEIHVDGESSTQGIVIAYAGISDVFFVPLKHNLGEQKLFFSLGATTRIDLETFPLGMIGLNINSTLLLGRDGRPRVLQLTRGEAGSPVWLVKECYGELEKKILSHTQGAAGTLLRDMDIFALWRYDAIDPRTRKRAVSEDEEEDGNGSIEGLDTPAAVNTTNVTTPAPTTVAGDNGDTVEERTVKQLVGGKVPRTESGGVA